MMSAPSFPHEAASGRVGIVDIGSNSVRLVVYDALKRAPLALYNEKVLCQLGKGLAITAKLNPQGAEMARAAIARFLSMARAMEVPRLEIMATAAVRDAKDGQEFVEEIERRHQVDIHVISGEEEARLGAYGVCASIHQPEGISGDLGGGSMELVLLDKKQHAEHITLPIGALRLLDQSGGDRKRIREVVKRELSSVNWLQGRKHKAFYAIGGSFRAIARMHMEKTNYPLHILHEYTVSPKQFLPFVRELAAMPEDALAALPGGAAKRAAALIPASIILDEMLTSAQPSEVVFSASGIREGYLYEKLPEQLRAEDALLASCTEFAVKGGRGTAYANELYSWMGVLFAKESKRDARLRFASCLLADIARYIHPEYRADWAMQRILQSNLTALTHEERVLLALNMYHRYQFKYKADVPALALLKEKDRAQAKLWGAAANLAYHLTGGIPGTLPRTQLEITKNKVSLSLPAELQALHGEAVKKRLSGLEEAWAERA